MKKLLYAIIILSLSIFTIISFSSCTEENDEATVLPGETVTLNVYNWGEYISDGFEGCPDVNLLFEEYFYKKTGIRVKVNYTTYATNEDMYSKLSSGAGNYDVIFPSDYMVQRMAEEGMLYSFGAENIENYKYIENDFKGLYYDEDEQYSVPYTYGKVGVIYNYTLMHPEDVDEDGNILDPSWSLLWNEDYSGKILQFNNPRDAFGTAMFYKNLDINSKDKSVWNEALELLKKQKPLVQGYVNDEIFNKMTTGSATVAPYFAGDFITMLEDNEYLKFYYPKEGTNIFVDAMCIPVNSKHKDIAMEYINFMLSEEAAVANALYIMYASPNSLVKNNEEYLDEIGEEAYEILYDTKDVNANYDYDPYYHSFSDLVVDGDNMQEYINGLWESLKTTNAIEPWIHVVSILIVGGVLTFAIYNVYIKKKRSSFYRKRDREKKNA